MSFPFTVPLQPPFSFRLLMLVCGLLLLLAGILLWVVFRYRLRDRLRRPDTAAMRQPSEAEMTAIRQKYLKELAALEHDFAAGQTRARETYLSLSSLIRRFVGEMTGIRLQECTLSDIRKLHMPALAQLVEEYYVPEFADYDDRPEQEGTSARRRISDTYVRGSLRRTGRAIERWR